MNRNGWLLLLTTLAIAGCHAPLPTARSLLSPPGSTTVAPPATGAIGDNYYPPTAGSAAASGAPGLPPPPPYQPRVAPATPLPGSRSLDPPPTGGSLPAASDLEMSRGAPTRLRISRSAAQGVSWSSPSHHAPSLASGRLAAEGPAEPRPFMPPVRMLEISELPDAPPRVTASPRITAPPRIAAPPVLTTPGRPPQRSYSTGGDLWKSRNR